MHAEHTLYPTNAYAALRGVPLVTAVTTPAAGAEWSFPLLGGYYRRLIGGTAKFVTSAAVANRFVGISVTAPEGSVYQGAQPVALAASNTITAAYNTAGLSSAAGGLKGSWVVTAPPMWLPPGYTLQSSTVAMDVADQYSAIVLWFEQLERQTLYDMTAKLEIDLMEVS